MPSFLGSRLITCLALGPIIYVALVITLLFSGPQRALVFLNDANFPFNVDFDRPETLGFAHGRVRALNLTTPDGLNLRAMFFLPLDIYHDQVDAGVPRDSDAILELALKERDSVIYLHGNAGNMALPQRLHTSRRISEYMGMNLLIIDYRGYGASEGTPSEEGLAIDGRVPWTWLTDRGVPSERITFLGHSLGTGVATRVVRDLERDGHRVKALILKAPYTSLPEVSTDFKFLGFIPFFLPFKVIPGAQAFIRSKMDTHFATRELLPSIRCDIAILHGAQDGQIPVSHAHLLQNLLLPPSHPADVEKVEVHPLHPSLITTGEYSIRQAKKGGQSLLFVDLNQAGHNDVQNYDVTWESLRLFLRGESVVQ